MALSKQRIQHDGETAYPWEREAVDFVVAGLPDVEPYTAWNLVEFVEPSTGRLYEVDMLVLTRQALFVVEIKSHPGKFTGDSRDWAIEHEGRIKYLDNPLYLTNRKSKVIASLLNRELAPQDRVWVEPLVFLSGATELRLAESGMVGVVDRAKVIRALTHGEYPGGQQRARGVDRRIMREVVAAMRKIGIRESRASRLVGQYKLGTLLTEGPGYQEHRGEHTSIEGMTARIRSYLVPRGRSPEARSQLDRAAVREAQILTRLGEHRRILRCVDLKPDAPLGPALVFEPFPRGEPLDAFVRRQPDLSFDDRLEILNQIADALHYCHRSHVLHRNLSPSAVLVRKDDGQPIETKLHSFQLAMQQEGSIGTRHLTELSEDAGLLYRAPEVLQDPAKALPESDIFSLGAVGFFVLTGQPPAASLAAREKFLAEHHGLRVSSARDDLWPGVEKVIAEATDFYPPNRPDDAIFWASLLMEEATRPPEAAQAVVDPLVAKPGEELPGGLVVREFLGSGATSRVVRVEKDGKSFALKIPLDDGCAERLRSEHELLKRLRHQHIVSAESMRKVGVRECLLLEFVGSDNREDPQNLSDLLRRDGTVGLDFARRYGDDLLSAVQYLEEHGVQHRDIKPANIGFTPSSKQARHLVLIDFSLVTADPSNVMVGTPAYRDPYLRMRGAWDAAADRYSVALVLYEMLSGARPVMDESAAAGLPTLKVDAERFDAALRDRFLAFFERALAPRVEDRFDSAERMKTSWLGLFAEQPRPVPVRAASERAPELEPEPERPTFDPSTATPKTPIDALAAVLSARARNALDRAGVATVGELVQLPRNFLSAVRGVGTLVAKEIQDVADLFRERFSQISAVDADVLAPGYAGPRVALGPGCSFGLDPEQVQRLRDAGIASTVELASTARERVRRILGGDDADALRAAMLAGQTEQPDYTIERWASELLAPAKKKASAAEKQVLALVGVTPEGTANPGGVEVKVVAEAFKVTRAAVYINLTKARERWETAAGLPSLVDAVREVLEAAGGAMPVHDAALELARRRSGLAEPDGDLLRRAGALVRVAGEVRGENLAFETVDLVRMAGQLWAGIDREVLDIAKRIGEVADELAVTEPLPSSEKARTALEKAAEGTALAALPTEKLVSMAVKASRGAAMSARLEVYPKGMDAARALTLSAGALALTEIDPDEVARRVRTRYPEAAVLPARPQLDELLAGYGLVFDESAGRYRRKTEPLPTSTGTLVQPPPRMRTAMPNQALLRTPEAQEAAAFDASLRASVERGRFRVLQASAEESEYVALVLARQLDVQPTSLDQLLSRHIEVKRKQFGVDSAKVWQADRDRTTEFELLRKLVGAAADDLVGEILSRREKPWLLVHPGAFATYGLGAQLGKLVDRADREDGAAVLLVVPCPDDGAPPSINGKLPVPTPVPGQRMRVPRSWIMNAHRAGA
jgi:serine/threonine protein kinase